MIATVAYISDYVDGTQTTPGATWDGMALTIVLSDFEGYGAIQPFLGMDQQGSEASSSPQVNSVTGRVQILSGATILADVSISGSVTFMAPPNTVTAISVASTWNAGFVASPDLPVKEPLRAMDFPFRAPVSEGTSNIVGSSKAGTSFFLADYSQLCIPPGAVARVTCSASNTFGTAKPRGGLFFSTRPQASFTNSGSATGTLLINGGGSLDSTRSGTYLDDPANFLTAYIWDWGDGSAPETFTAPTASHEYSTSGTYTVTLEVRDKYAGRARTSQSVTVTAAESGRVVSFCCDRSGFIMRSRVTGTPAALVTDRHNGLVWEQTHSTALLQKPGLSTPRDYARVFRIVQVIADKTWRLEYSDDYGTWQTMAVPFDGTYKAVSAVAWSPAGGMVAGIDASNVIRVKTTVDGGKTWQGAYNGATLASPGGASKSVELVFDASRGRYTLQADATLSKTQSDLTGVGAWGNL